MKLDCEKLSHALGVAGYLAPVQMGTKWLNTIPGPTVKYAPAGWMSEAEITAALLAQLGHVGDLSVLDGEHGLWVSLGSGKWDPRPVVSELGKDWRFPALAVYKPYPCTRLFHGALDCFIETIERNGLHPGDIEKVVALLEGFCMEYPAWRNTEITSHIDAQMSAPYAFAVAAHRIPPEAWQDPETIRNPAILEFMRKVSVAPHPGWAKALSEDPTARLAGVEVRAGGKTFRLEKRHPKGTPTTPESKMSDEELSIKFRRNASRILTRSKIDKAVKYIGEMEKIESLSELLDSIRP